MEQIAIIGLGLMGGSLGLALKQRGLPLRINGFTRSPERGRMALARKAIDRLLPTPGEAVGGADFVIYCAPILTIPGLVAASLAGLKDGCTLTDVGSTKTFLVREINALIAARPGVAYVGSHPIAGSERQGIESARADLYEGATVVVTPNAQASGAHVTRVREFWQKVGGIVYEMDATQHDLMVAKTSHLPHMVASLLVATVARTNNANELAAFCGSGFRDTTRVAEGSSEIWKDIVESNAGYVADELRAFREQLDALLRQLETGDFDGISAFLDRGGALRKALVAKSAARRNEGGET